jgi:hypothetical protein
MADYFESLGNAVVDRSPDELVGAVIIALALSLAFAGIYFIGQRKVSGATLMPMTALLLVANLTSMAVGAGYLLHVKANAGYLTEDKTPRAMGPPGPMLVDLIFRDADTNHDGLLSSEEASQAAAELVRNADPSGKGLVDARALEHALPGAGFHGPGPAGHPMPPFGPPSPGPPFYGPPDRSGRGPLRPVGPPPADEGDEDRPSTDAAHQPNHPGN